MPQQFAAVTCDTPDSVSLSDWCHNQLERFKIEPGNRPIAFHTSAWLLTAKQKSAPGQSIVKVALTADDPAALVVEELQTRIERGSVSFQDDFAKRFSPVEETIHTIRDLRFALQWTNDKLHSAAHVPTNPLSSAEVIVGGTDAADGVGLVSDAATPAQKAKAGDEKLSDAVAAVRGVWEWAISTIEGADAKTIPELFDAIQSHPEMTSEYLDRLPDNADTFGTYLRRAGIRRYKTSGSRARRPSRHPRT